MSFTNLPNTVLNFNISYNIFENLVLDKSSFTLPPLPLSSSKVEVKIDIRGNHISCPFPGIFDITDANPSKSVTVFNDGCETNFVFFTKGSVVLASLGVIAFLTIRIFPKMKRMLMKYNKQIRISIFFVGYLFRFLNIFNDVLSYNYMINASLIQFPDLCPTVNDKVKFLTSMYSWTNPQDSIPYPDYSCQNINSTDCGGISAYSNKYTTFSTYLSLLRNGWPQKYFPELVNQDVQTFEKLCSGFIIKYDKNECQYNDVLSSCERRSNISATINNNFLVLIYASIVVMYSKELVKALIVIWVYVKNISGPSLTGPIRGFIISSSMVPLLAYRKTFPFVQEIILPKLEVKFLLTKLFIDTILENLNQVVLILYFALYVNQTGLGTPLLIGISTSIIGFLKIAAEFIILLRPIKSSGEVSSKYFCFIF